MHTIRNIDNSLTQFQKPVNIWKQVEAGSNQKKKMSNVDFVSLQSSIAHYTELDVYPHKYIRLKIWGPSHSCSEIITVSVAFDRMGELR